MATNSDLKPFRQIDHLYQTTDLFVYSGSIPVTKGTVVKIAGSGFTPDTAGLAWLGQIGQGYTNVLSQRYGSVPYVTDAGTGDYPIGVLLRDVREVDEHGNKLIFDTKKADEREYVLSGQPVPIVNKGLILVSGTFNGSVVAGQQAYASGNGAYTNNALNQNKAIGQFWSAVNSQGYALIKLDC